MVSPTSSIPAPAGPMEIVAQLLLAVSNGDVAAASRLFASDARVVRLRYAAGRVRGGETIAVGRTAISEWLADAARHFVVAHATAHHFEGELLVVRTASAMTGFSGERVQSSSLAVYQFGDEGLISLYRATSHEEEEDEQDPRPLQRFL